MLTTKVISTKQGESYYAQENSYSTAQSVANSQWMGKGAAKLGLNGQVKSADFKNLLHGRLPDGTRFRRNKQRQGYLERAGLDCTFSAPKSVSILALVVGLKVIEKAHKEAVLETLKIIEKEYAATRATKNCRVQIINTDNLLIGQFHHDTSRELDPHLHSHCVILNLTEHNNKWYSFRNDDIFANRKLLGGIYRNQLALKVQELGYSIETKEDGLFEIDGFTPEQLQTVSKRRQQILSKLKENATWKESEIIWDKTRTAKTKAIPRKELQEIWREQLEDISYPKPNRNKESDIQKTLDRAVELDRAIDDGIAHYAERNVVFKPEAVRQFVLAEAGKYDYQEVSKAIASNNELIHLDKQVTTQSALLRELATIKLMKESQNKFQPLANSEVTKQFTRGLTLGQKNAIALAATTSDRFIAWQGETGVGKTYALNQFKQLATDEGYMVKGFAPSASSAQALSKEMGIEATTVASLLVSQFEQLEQPEQGQIWIVDEAGLLGAKTTLKLLQQAEEENAKVLLVGDTKQLSSVEAGNPFKSLQQAGMATAHLNQSPYQKSADLRQAVDLISKGKATEGIEILEKHQGLTELPELETRACRIAQDYLNLSEFERQKTLVIAGTHRERQSITEHIRQGLKESGNLGKEVSATRLKSKSLTAVQKQYSHHYEPGDVVIPFANYKRWGLEKDRQYQVTAVEKDAVTLVGQDNIAQKVNPKWFKHKDVYQVESTRIAVGDKLRWGKNDKQLNRVNGAEFVVTDIDGTTATIRTAKGKEEKIDLENAQHLDHALVSTVYSSQGATADRVFASLSNNLTTNAESFYVAASRAKYDLHLYVENFTELLDKVSSNEVQANSIELIGKYSATTIETEQFNHERNTFQLDSQRNYSEQSQPSRETSQKPRIKPERIVELAEYINRFIDEQRAESLEGSFRKLKQQLDNRISATGITAKLGNSIKQLDRTLTEYSHQRKQGERVRKLDKIKNSLLSSILEDDPHLITAAKKLELTLNNQPSKLNNLKQLQATINQYEKLHKENKLKNKVDGLVTSITDISSQKELETLTHYQLDLRRNYLDAKQKISGSGFSASEHDNLGFDVELAKYLKSKSWSVSDICSTLAQSDRVHELLQQHRHDLGHYQKQVAKYIFSVGTKAGLTFEDYLEKEQSPHKQKKSAPEIEL